MSLAAGKETLSYCTSCKMDLQHIIVAMKGDQVQKVECKTCNKIHAFRAPKGVTEPKKKAKKAAKDKDEKRPVHAEWEKLMASHKDAPAKPYAPKSSFAVGDKLRHGQFGDGIVGRVIFPNKIEVIFQADVKILVHTAALAR